MIGDMISRDILVGKNANIKTCYLTHNPSKPDINEKLMKEENIIPDFII